MQSLRQLLQQWIAPWYGKGLRKFRRGRVFSRIYDRLFRLFTPKEREQVDTIYGFSLWINPRGMVVERNLQLYGVYERTVCEAMHRLLQPGDTFVDIGANIGYHTLLAAYGVGVHGKVLACEPAKANLDLLYKNCANYPQITILPFGLGQIEQKITLFYDTMNPGASSVVVPTQQHETISIKKGDDVFAEIAHIAVIKIDIEGYEFEAMKGMHYTLASKTDALLFEYSPAFFSHLASDVNAYAHEMITWLVGCGFVCRYDLGVGKEAKARPLLGCDPMKLIAQLQQTQTNILCMKQPYNLFDLHHKDSEQDESE